MALLVHRKLGKYLGRQRLRQHPEHDHGALRVQFFDERCDIHLVQFHKLFLQQAVFFLLCQLQKMLHVKCFISIIRHFLFPHNLLFLPGISGKDSCDHGDKAIASGKSKDTGYN